MILISSVSPSMNCNRGWFPKTFVRAVCFFTPKQQEEMPQFFINNVTAYYWFSSLPKEEIIWKLCNILTIGDLLGCQDESTFIPNEVLHQTHMYENHSLVRQLQDSSGHVVHSGHLATLKHLPNAVTTGRESLHTGSWLKEMAAQGQAHQTAGRLHIQHTSPHLEGQTQGNIALLYVSIQQGRAASLRAEKIKCDSLVVHVPCLLQHSWRPALAPCGGSPPGRWRKTGSPGSDHVWSPAKQMHELHHNETRLK